jgi:hypothetical protein
LFLQKHRPSNSAIIFFDINTAANNQTGNNRIFETHFVDLTEMDTIIPRAVSDESGQWVRSRMATAQDNTNDTINAFRSSAEEMIFLHRATGGDLNEEGELNELYLSLVVNIGSGVGKEHPESYTQHPTGFGNAMVRSVAGVDTSDPVGTLACANRIRDGIKARDNRHHRDVMVAIAEQQLNRLAEKIEYKDADTAVEPTDEEVDEAADVIRRSIKRQCLTPDRVIGLTFGDIHSMNDFAN